MQYGLAFGYFIQRTGGFTNLLLVTVCQFIPIVGPIVVLGYRSEVAQALVCDDELRRHPKFDFNRFVEYLTRGVWPFVMSLIIVFVAIPVIMLVLLASILIGAAANLLEVGIAVGVGFYILALFLVIAFSVPMTFHAELAGKFDLKGAFRFAKEFWSTVGGSAILTGLVFVPLSLIVALLGLLCLIVGVYFASTISQMAGQHLMVQLYVEYLERGGSPIREYDPRDQYEDDEEFEDDRDDRRRRRRDE